MKLVLFCLFVLGAFIWLAQDEERTEATRREAELNRMSAQIAEKICAHRPQLCKEK